MRIRDLYAGCDELMAAWQDAAALAPRDIAAAAAPGLQEPAKKALATLYREWGGLAARRDCPMISLDGDKAGRMIRGPVVTRDHRKSPAAAARRPHPR